MQGFNLFTTELGHVEDEIFKKRRNDEVMDGTDPSVVRVSVLRVLAIGMSLCNQRLLV